MGWLNNEGLSKFKAMLDNTLGADLNEHKDKKVTDNAGVHDLRYASGKLQVKQNNEWVDVLVEYTTAELDQIWNEVKNG